SDLAARRDDLAARLRDAGWDVPDAQGNFVWLPAGERALEVAAAFEDAGLIVRPFAGDGVRISIGEHESIDQVVRVAASVAPR
ncbi:aminotransferase, partial [Microbacterium sp. 2C]|nr:aminotransferase [Microbacterium paulum]